MKIAIVFPHLPVPEEESLTYERSLRERFLSRQLNVNGIETLLCYLTHHPEPFISGEDANRALFFPVDDKARKKDRKFYTSIALGKTLKDFDPDVIAFKGMGYYLPYWLYRKKFVNSRVAFIAGGNPYDILLPAASHIFSEFKSQLTDVYKRYNKRNLVSVLGKYIPEDEFQKGENKDTDIISVGSAIPRKNLKALIPFFGNYRIKIIGDGPELPALKKAAMGLDGIEFTGNLPKMEVSSMIRRSRLMVHPSRHEGFPRAFSEAFASGVPVVAFKRAIQGEFPEGRAGLLVEDRELVSTVESLLDNKTVLADYSKNAYALAEESYRGDIIFQQFRSGLETAMDLDGLKFSFHMRITLCCRWGLWILDYYFFLIARKVKRKLFMFLRR